VQQIIEQVICELRHSTKKNVNKVTQYARGPQTRMEARLEGRVPTPVIFHFTSDWNSLKLFLNCELL